MLGETELLELILSWALDWKIIQAVQLIRRWNFHWAETSCHRKHDKCSVFPGKITKHCSSVPLWLNSIPAAHQGFSRGITIKSKNRITWISIPKQLSRSILKDGGCSESIPFQQKCKQGRVYLKYIKYLCLFFFFFPCSIQQKAGSKSQVQPDLWVPDRGGLHWPALDNPVRIPW